jgi:CubicO group peptidase (beta-lactamase class C family)
MTVDITGFCPDRFSAVRDAFAANFDSAASPGAGELGARFSLALHGEVIVDLMGGFADRKRQVAFGPDTLTPLFSTTKIVAALLIARLVDQGRLTYDTTVASVWPEFAQNRQAGRHRRPGDVAPGRPVGLSRRDRPGHLVRLGGHDRQAGGHGPAVAGRLGQRLSPGDLRLHGRRDLPPRRRPDHGHRLREDLAEPLDLDLWIGLPDSEHARCAELMRPTALPKFGAMNDAVKAAFMTKWAAPGGRGTAEWRRAEIPSANGHATAPALARLMGALASGGELDGVPVLSPALIAEGFGRADRRPGPGPALHDQLGRGLHAQHAQLLLRPDRRRPSATAAGAARAPSPTRRAACRGPM